MLRLEALGHVAAALPPGEDKPLITESKLRSILNTGDFAKTFQLLEDPILSPFTESIGFVSGSFLILPGLDKEISFVLRNLLKAIFLHRGPLSDHEFVRRAGVISAAALTLSDAITSRAGLRRGMPPSSRHHGPVSVPTRNELRRLAQATVFHDDELQRLFKPFEGSPSDLDDLTVQMGGLDVATYSPDNAPLTRRPIVRSGSRIAVAAPSELASALVTHVVETAVRLGFGGQLAERYHDAVWTRVCELLRLTRNRPLDSTAVPAPTSPLAKHRLFTLDCDKAICVVFLSDSLQGIGAGTGNDRWPAGCLQSLAEKVTNLERQIYSAQPRPSGLLLLIVLQHLGHAEFGLPVPVVASDSSALVVTAAELETICECEIGEPLALWKFSRAAHRAHSRRDIMTMSTLDDFNLYRHCHHSYYLSDDRIDLVATIPDEGGRLRQELCQHQDLHSVRSHDGKHVTEVRTIYDTATIPIYVPCQGFDHGVRFLVEALPAPVWILASESDPAKAAAPPDVVFRVGEAVAYWMWQLSSSIRQRLESLADEKHTILIRLVWSGGREDWAATFEGVPGEPPPEFCSVSTNRDTRTVTIALAPSFEVALMTSDNSAERQLLIRLLEGLRTLLADEERAAWTDAALREAVEKHAPLGIKKKIFTLNVANNPQLCPLDSPNFRPIQESDEQDVLDGIGQHLRNSGWKGAIAREKRTKALNAAVDHCFRNMTSIVEELSSEGLLEFLVAHHEALILAEARHRLTIPTRLACFADEKAMLEQFSKQQNDFNKASVAGRFLIEYVAASSPRGKKEISLEMYDRLQALAAAIVDFGFASELVHLRLTDPSVSILGSGRLAYVSHDFDRAKNAFLPKFTASEVVQATQHFDRHWPGQARTGSGSADSLQVKIEDASAGEFGASLSDLLSVMWGAALLRLQPDQPFVVLEEDEFVSKLAERLQWDKGRVSNCVRILTLEQRADFLQPPSPPYSPQDVLPWIFKRRLSYLRRPFLVREDSGKRRLVYGLRHTEIASRTLLSLVFSGRYRAQTAPMCRLMGEIAHRAGEAFNNRVGSDVLERDASLVVKRKLKKVGNLRVPGDIDVLAASTKRHTVFLLECKDLALWSHPSRIREPN